MPKQLKTVTTTPAHAPRKPRVGGAAVCGTIIPPGRIRRIMTARGMHGAGERRRAPPDCAAWMTGVAQYLSTQLITSGMSHTVASRRSMLNGHVDLAVAVRDVLPAGKYVVAGAPIECVAPKRRVAKVAAAAV